MGQQQSQNKDKLLYQQVKYGNIQMIKALFLEGARLEWADKQGKTPLIAACLQAELYDVAKTLLKLGANVNTYRPGTQAGTPIHHAAKSGLEPTVKLLLSHGSEVLLVDFISKKYMTCHNSFISIFFSNQTPMDVARAKGHNHVVRTIENHICLFYGWLQELHGPGFLEESSSRSNSNKIWAVVIPSAFYSPAKPRKLLLIIYCTQDAQPRSVILLWKAKIEEPEFHQLDPTFVIFDEHTKTQYKFASADEGDKKQLQCFYNACTGISQVIRSSLQLDSTPSNVPATAPPMTTEDVDLAVDIKASNDYAMGKKPPQYHPCHRSGVNHTIDTNGLIYHEDEYDWWLHLLGAAYPSECCSSERLNKPVNDMYNGPSSNATKQWEPSGTPMMQENPGRIAIPSAPPIPEEADNGQETDYSQLDFFGRVTIPSAPPIPKDADSGPETKSNRIALPGQSLESMGARKGELKEDESDSSACAICLDAPKEGACLPCGHRAGCMSCLNEIKAKKCGCPLCRAKIQQVVRIYV